MVILLRHVVICGRSGGQWEQGAISYMRNEVGDVSKQPFMKVTDINHVVDEIHFGINNIV